MSGAAVQVWMKRRVPQRSMYGLWSHREKEPAGLCAVMVMTEWSMGACCWKGVRL